MMQKFSSFAVKRNIMGNSGIIINFSFSSIGHDAVLDQETVWWSQGSG